MRAALGAIGTIGAVALAVAAPAWARTVAPTGTGASPTRAARIVVPTRPATGLTVQVRATRCGRARLKVGVAGRTRTWPLRGGAQTLRWRVRIPAGRRGVRVRPVRAADRCRVAVDRLHLREVVVLGAALEARHLDVPGYAAAASRFSGVTPENAMKMDVLQPRRHDFRFGAADRVVGFARAHGQEVHGHPLVWGDQVPAWVRRPPLLEQWTRDELREVMREHIHAVVGRYKGQVASWDVVNEAVTASGTLRPNVWQEVLGPSYIDDAFRWAHEADPAARLYYNEYDMEHGGPRADAVLELLQGIRARGVPVHGVGFQSHLDARTAPSSAALSAIIARFADAGLDVAFSEVDVGRRGLLDPQATVLQTAAYRSIARACARQVRCRRVTVWGVADPFSWRGPLQAALPIDGGFEPKPAWCPLVRRLAARACR